MAPRKLAAGNWKMNGNLAALAGVALGEHQIQFAIGAVPLTILYRPAFGDHPFRY